MRVQDVPSGITNVRAPARRAADATAAAEALAFRLGEALGLTMIGPLEKPVRLQELERVLTEVRSSFAE